MFGLTMTADVYVPNNTTGTYSAAVALALPCRLTLVSPNDGVSARDRAELSAMRRLLWDSDTVLPEAARVSVDGVLWSIIPGSMALVTGVGGVPVYRRAEVERVLV